VKTAKHFNTLTFGTDTAGFLQAGMSSDIKVLNTNTKSSLYLAH